MKLISPSFAHKSSIPAIYTCDGDDRNPPLVIEDVPEEARSLVLIVEDPDVPRQIRSDGKWDHWVVYNIPANVRVIAEGVEPPGMHGVGTAGHPGYHGPCPPPNGAHRYFFKLFALDTTLNLRFEPSKVDVLTAMAGHVLDQAELVGLYQRS